MQKLSYLSNSDVQTVDYLYEQYKKDPNSIDITWKKFFEGFEFAKTDFNNISFSKSLPNGISEKIAEEFKVINLINAYRTRGHLFTKTNPVRERRTYMPNLDIEHFDLKESQLDDVFKSGNIIGLNNASLRDIIKRLKNTYCSSVGIEYMYIRTPEVISWFQEKLEISENKTIFSIEEKLKFLHNISHAVLFENFIHKKFIGQKRFSLEGAENFIPALDTVIRKGSLMGIKEFVIGMAHRGRLNVLANIFRKNYGQIFNEFFGNEYSDPHFSGDVKYHLGFSTQREFKKENTKVNLHLCPNPSHLEAVNPIVEGFARSRIEKIYNGDFNKLVPILVHGDAAIAGQGVVYEVIQMAQLDAYKTGGTIHIIINNQVGFTTNYIDARSSIYCTDVAKTTLSPVIHVNGDDVEAIVHSVQLALDFRQKFNKDVFIDLLCYRKYGHNEGDEPMFTQPLLYKIINSHPNPLEIYSKQILKEGSLTQETYDAVNEKFNNKLQNLLNEAAEKKLNEVDPLLKDEWEKYKTVSINPLDKEIFKPIKTSFAKNKLIEIGNKLNTLPKNLSFYKKTEKLMEQRLEMIKNNSLDWGTTELMAYGSLLSQGHSVRFTGQDVERGTFTHRHAIITCEESEEKYFALNTLTKDGEAKAYIHNSHLSEYAVLGFEYGYAMSSPDDLVIWEAQFGDFVNGAQIILDQYLSTSELKWHQKNAIVLLLPHGYEGQGAEHSNARIERFLTLCSNNNMFIVNCSTPASFFHVIRRQLCGLIRKPLVIFTPKSLLRNPKCISSLDQLSNDFFEEIIDDEKVDKSKVEKIILCSGKFYYDLDEYRTNLNNLTYALIRIEQYYPLNIDKLNKIISKYPNANKIAYAQEEPENYGALPYFYRKLKLDKFKEIIYFSRPESAVSATGSPKKHKQEEKELLNKVFAF